MKRTHRRGRAELVGCLVPQLFVSHIVNLFNISSTCRRLSRLGFFQFPEADPFAPFELPSRRVGVNLNA